MSNLLASIKNPALLSRHEQLAAETAVMIDSAAHAAGVVLPRGTLVGKLASGKHRAYAEALTSGSGFGTGSASFQLDPASALIGFLKAGDVIESVAGAALGTILTIVPSTGAGTLVANSASALAAGQSVRIALSVLPLSGLRGKVLKDECQMPADGTDQIVAAYFEAFVVKASTTITDAAIAAAGSWAEFEAGEVRLK